MSRTLAWKYHTFSSAGMCRKHQAFGHRVSGQIDPPISAFVLLGPAGLQAGLLAAGRPRWCAGVYAVLMARFGTLRVDRPSVFHPGRRYGR
jgi:hypothetical protein